MTEQISNRAYRQFYSKFGFDDNPFGSSNADQEDRLLDYFVPPPYFPAVFGNPERPQSFVVFAPRGGGKSAQRRKMESTCAESQVLAITYDRFEFPEIQRAADVTINHHLRTLLRYSLMGLLVTLNANRGLKENLSKYDRQIIVKLAAEYLDNINELTVQSVLDSLKSMQDKTREFWNEWLPAIGPALKMLFKRLLDVDLNSLTEYKDPAFGKIDSLKSQLGLIVGLAQKLGYKSIYFLVDRVDESSLTGNDAVASFKMLEPLLRDLELLETKGVGFKFFLWDRLEPPYQEIARTDRIRQETLEWDDDMLSMLWQRRLLAYSARKIKSLDEISEQTRPYSPDRLALIFANRSPRDMIRIGSQIMVEQQEIEIQATKIHSRAIYSGIEKFCAIRALELVSNRTLHELRRVGQADFTIPFLANVIWKEKQATVRNRLYLWRKEGAIVDVDRIDDPNSQQLRTVKLLALADIRVAQNVHSDLGIPRFLEKKYRQCPTCGSTVLRDWGDADSLPRCHFCQYDLTMEQDGLEQWRRKDFATQSRKRQRKEEVDLSQMSFEEYLRIAADDVDGIS